MEDFFNTAKVLGKNILFVQGAGGNASVKLHNKLYVKASGKNLRDMKKGQSYVCCEYKPLVSFINTRKRLEKKDEENFLKLITKNILPKESFGNSSMETGFHAVISSKYVFHLHSVYANIFTCMKSGEKDIKKIFFDVPFTMIDYKNPGYELAYYLSKEKKLESLIFLKNHGIIVHGKSTTYCLKLITLLHDRIEKYLKERNAYKPFKIIKKYEKVSNYSFPDSAVFADVKINALSKQKKQDVREIMSAQQYIVETIKDLGRSPVYLPKEAAKKLLSMNQEKYRIGLLKNK